jgi:hypothetical protein
MMDELKNNYEKWNNSNQESLWGGGGKTFVSLEFIIYVSACAFFIGKIFVKFLPGKYGF